jgi:hypothetical protein
MKERLHTILEFAFIIGFTIMLFAVAFGFAGCGAILFKSVLK